MAKMIVKRGLIGFFIGIAADYIIAYIVSAYLRLGYFMPCLSGMPEIIGGEMKAVAFQALAFGILVAGIGIVTVTAKADKIPLAGRIALSAIIGALCLSPIAALAVITL